MLNPALQRVRPRRRRSDNRIAAVRDAAAGLFAARGYAGTSMRDIAGACGMLPGSLYYHFATKEDLLCEVYRRGVDELRKGVKHEVDRAGDGWDRLEAACRAHLEIVLRDSDYAQVLVRVLPTDVPGAAARLMELRASYESILRDVVATLDLPAGTDRRALRLMLLGTLNWSRFWFDPEGSETFRSLAHKFVQLLKEPLAGRNSHG